MEIKEKFSKEDLCEISVLLLHARDRLLKIAYDIEHPYEDKRRKANGEQVKKRMQICYERANHYCDLSNTVVEIAESLN